MARSRQLVESLAKKLLAKVTETHPWGQPPIIGPGGKEPEATNTLANRLADRLEQVYPGLSSDTFDELIQEGES